MQHSRTKIYVVQTTDKVIERCLLMTTDPGDLVLDPTCGSGTTAFVAEKWGRRWITCDTSRVAVTLAKQRLMTASYDYYELKLSARGPEGRLHLQDRAARHAQVHRQQPGDRRDLRADAPGDRRRRWRQLNAASSQASSREADLAAGMGGAVRLSRRTGPRPAAAVRRLSRRPPGDAEPDGRVHRRPCRPGNPLRPAARSPKTSCASPARSPSRRCRSRPCCRWTRPTASQEADAAVARSGESARQHQWRDELLKTGIRGKGGQMLTFAELETLPGDPLPARQWPPGDTRRARGRQLRPGTRGAGAAPGGTGPARGGRRCSRCPR